MSKKAFHVLCSSRTVVVIIIGRPLLFFTTSSTFFCQKEKSYIDLNNGHKTILTMTPPGRRLLLALLTSLLLPVHSIGFANPQAQGMLERDTDRLIKEHKSSKHFAKPKDKDDVVKVGSKEYYDGFVSRDLVEEEDRVTGDALLGPTVKFVGSVSVLIAALLLVFLLSNGLLL
jgi:hypothetical protein